MLSAQLKEARAKKEERIKEMETQRANAIAASSKLTSALWKEVNVGGKKVYEAEEAVERELRKVDLEMRRFQQQNRSWLALIDDLADELKSLGDVTNWLEYTEQQVIRVADEISRLEDSGEDSRDESSS
mmetsp:Transcript_167/g.523  ORF Transcript_167/g.523 Transcript_167/m.523 type:complete len:129 (-) Transcript_167:422-808(-)|eukprot:CAMPEP_0198728186 /NCGR_PEP_ID=MMETSP1475-20131203/7775_1 /TAXON_ID= ORGANISM="Unidentified sp., Strain CCMP1999" /NCGR_SAMPLE_ID=MMETSP1475 /ASSEMBLY_ACC=CAM_ASM_001111 /LENGTH=128 /DNA_ID=CAMNT_0044490485 /DNA_START=97 /DNA_END=483 /DNA_ORIENTATION=+